MRCLNCGFPNPPGMHFCGNCGTALEVTTSSEERKLVTVLFADVVASTQLAGAVELERFHQQMSRFFDLAREEIERYGGRVQKFIGDAVMAIFGLPAIHEDDPERAARAALAIRSRVRSEAATGMLSNIRIGINSGEVVANPQAAGAGEFLISGEAVNLAARLQQHAEPGQILVGERMMLAIRPIAQLNALRSLMVKGRAEPLAAWELVEVAPPHPRELRATPFVGREEELDLLRGYLRRTLREGRGQVITILGPAGVGKTRLVWEFEIQAEGVHILRGRAVAYGTGVPFWSLGEAIREECGILFGDTLDVAREKLQKVAAQLDVADAVPALLSILGLGGEGRDLSREVLFRAMRALFQAVAHRTPLILILEDVHSAEDVTLDYLENAADWVREVPLLLLLLSRPELLDRRPGWMGGKRSASTLYLEPLSGEESHRLLGAILGGKPAPNPLLHSVLERAEGNPLFIEEMLGALIEGGVMVEEEDHWALTVPMAQVAIPDSVHAVIAARIDALPASQKQVLQDAAIQGKDLWLGALRFVAEGNHVDEAVGTLVGKELLIHKPRSSLAGDEEFTFRHILIRDVAYAMIPKAQRWQKHARLAEWMQEVAGDRPAEWADFIAHHWLQVVALRQELGLQPDPQAREQAIAHLLLAGDRAASVYANTTALDHYSRALDLNPEVGLRLRALLGRGEVWMLLGQYDRAREDFEAVRTLAKETGEPRWEAIALDHLGHSFRRQDQIARALEHLEPALSLSRQVGDPILRGHILNHMGFTHFTDAKHAEAMRAHEEARQLLESTGDLAGLAESFHGLGENLTFLGRFDEAIRWLRDSARLCEQMGNRSLAAENRYMIAFGRQKLAEYAEAQAEVQRSLTTLNEIGDVWNTSPCLMVAAGIAIQLGELGKALEYASRGLAIGHQIAVTRFSVYNLLMIGTIHREMEDHSGAWQVDREAEELAGKAVGAGWRPLVLTSLALDSVALGRTADAEAFIGEARRVLSEMQSRVDFLQEVIRAEGRLGLAVGRPHRALEAAKALQESVASSGILHWRIPALLLEAEANAALGEWATAASLYQMAARDAEGLGRLPVLWRALAGLAEAQRGLGLSDEAAASAKRAREIIDRLASAVPDERLRATFLQSAAVQRIFSLAGA